MSPMSDFLPFHFPAGAPYLPSSSLLAAFGITILSESFIYPSPRFIPSRIIWAQSPFNDSLSSPRSDRYIFPLPLPLLLLILPPLLLSLFLHRRCLVRHPISPSSVLLPPISFLISCSHPRSTTIPPSAAPPLLRPEQEGGRKKKKTEP